MSECRISNFIPDFECMNINVYDAHSSINPSIQLSIHSNIYLTIQPSIHPSIQPITQPTIYPSNHPTTHLLSINPCIYPSIHQYPFDHSFIKTCILLSNCSYIYPTNHRHNHLSIQPPIHQSKHSFIIYPFIHLHQFNHSNIHPSIQRIIH